MKHVILLLSVVFFFTVSAYSQKPNYEYGEQSELKGLSKVYVETHGDIDARNAIIREIVDGKVGLVSIDSRDEAEILIDYTYRETKEKLGRVDASTVDRRFDVVNPVLVKIKSCTAVVTIKGKTSANRRVVFYFSGFRSHPSEAFAKEFVKAVRKERK